MKLFSRLASRKFQYYVGQRSMHKKNINGKTIQFYFPTIHHKKFTIKEMNKRNMPRFQCDSCEKLFVTMHSVHKHQRSIHLNLGGIQCVQCCYTTDSPVQMKYHISHVHGNRAVYGCIICTALFEYNTERNKHIETYHSGIIRTKPEWVFPITQLYVNCKGSTQSDSDILPEVAHLSMSANKEKDDNVKLPQCPVDVQTSSCWLPSIQHVYSITMEQWEKM